MAGAWLSPEVKRSHVGGRMPPREESGEGREVGEGRGGSPERTSRDMGRARKSGGGGSGAKTRVRKS